MTNEMLQETAKEIRKTIIRAIHEAGSGHPGGSLSATDILTVLYFDEMNVDSKNPKMENRDKLVLSKGHAAPALYSVLAEKGYFPKEDVMTLRKINSKFQGHPNMNKVPGVEMSTGSLGQGFSASVGMALANRLDERDSRVYALLGDGELDEGLVWEAAMSAGHYKLDNLCVMVDWNGLQIDGKNEDVMTVTPIDSKFEAFGFNTCVLDGHNIDEIKKGLKIAREHKGQPTALIFKTHKGHGVSFMEDQAGWHGKAPNVEETELALKEIGGNK